jgi:hypothetical protein
MTKHKVGIQTRKIASEQKTLVVKGNDFVSVVDGVTFGLLDGKRFHSGRRDWSTEDQNNWAFANAQFFKTLARNLEQYKQAEKMGG